MIRLAVLPVVFLGVLLTQDAPKPAATRPAATLPAATQPALAATFTGTWQTTYGAMTLTEKDGKIDGTYAHGSGATITGRREKNRFVFTYKEPSAKGEGWFELAADGQSFEGEWRADGQNAFHSWTGRRGEAGTPNQPVAATAAATGFSGLWDTTYGRMRLMQEGTKVAGSYSYAASSKIDGDLEGRTLKVRYTEPTAKGVAEFTLAADGKSFTGRWMPDGQQNWLQWSGRRVEPKPGIIWLVVIEANWEGSLADTEYSFGQMLRSFFSRDPKVQVRQRFFTDEASLRRWLTEVKYLAEPVVISLSTHGSPAGLSVGGQNVGAKAIAECLHGAGNVKLLHFSACLAMQGNLPEEIQKLLGPTKIPISGYTTSVDWGASAVAEFMYFDLLLCRGYSPQRAEREMKKLLPYSGDNRVPGTAFAPLGLKLRMPGESTASRPTP